MSSEAATENGGVCAKIRKVIIAPRPSTQFRVSFMTVKAYVLLKVSSGSEREICKKIVELDGVMEANIIYGEFDLIAKVTAENLEQLEQFLTERIRTIPSIVLTSTMIVAREYKGRLARNPGNRN